MSRWGRPRVWPPEPIDELGALFAGLGQVRRGRVAVQPALFEVCEELSSWLADARDYSKRTRKDEWTSLIADVRFAVDDLGPRVRESAAGLLNVVEDLHAHLGRDPVTRVALRQRLEVTRAALTQSQVRVEAFDDLWAAVCDPEGSHALVSSRFSVLRSALAFANRSLSTVASTLAGVASDDLINVASARHALDGVEMPQELSDLRGDETAGLTVEERLELMRRVLTWRPARESHAVWVFFSRARFERWIFTLGPVTFIDGPVLLEVFEQLESAGASGLQGMRTMWWFEELPGEVVEGEEARFLRAAHNWPTGVEHWVAARVALGPGPHLDPVGEARRQADALVALARFHGSGSSASWVAMTGHLQIVDGVRRGASWPMTVPDHTDDDWRLRDQTDSWLVGKQSELELHWPVTDEALAELVECIAVLNEATRTTARAEEIGIAAVHGTSSAVWGPVVFLQRVRVLELLASRVGVTWMRLMEDHLMNAWLREQLLERVFNAVERATADTQLCRHDDALGRIRRKLLTRGDGLMVTTHRDVALAALPDLAARLPAHHRDARRIREVAAATADLASLEAWIGRLRQEYQRRSGRALRCRNSLTHGGPLGTEAVASVNPFIGWQAGLATVAALRGVLSGSSVDAALDAKRNELTTWEAGIGTAADVTEALVPKSAKPAPSPTSNTTP